MHRVSELTRKNICKSIAEKVVRDNPSMDHADMLKVALENYRDQIRDRTDIRYGFGDDDYMSWWLAFIKDRQQVKSPSGAGGAYRRLRG